MEEIAGLFVPLPLHTLNVLVSSGHEMGLFTGQCFIQGELLDHGSRNYTNSTLTIFQIQSRNYFAQWHSDKAILSKMSYL